jgi:hypothetical protein
MDIKHIGNIRALCDRRKPASLREDMGKPWYRSAGRGKERRLLNEKPYRICTACIKALP